ncbi:MAG: iron-sulfur cluster-binding domain-containing protein [Clostridia bacterium]|nr:iron-sulfur cluster-binding domain-containing protein [Clostridia bacterium]
MSKTQSKIKSLKRRAFIGLVTNRLKAINSASTEEVRDLMSYRPNSIAAELHPHIQHLVVKEINVHSEDMKSFIFAPDKEAGTEKIAWFSAGQYLSVCVDIDGVKFCRPYSIASSPRDTLKDEIMITVKRVDGGICSGYILDNYKVGTKVVTSGPLGDFTYERLRDAKTIIGIAGGSGITPFRSLAKAIVEEDEKCSLILLYGSRTLKDAVFTDEIKMMAKSSDKIQIVNVLSEEEAEGCEKGFITADLIKKYAPSEYSIFMCGPQAMYNFVDKEIEKLNIRQKFVRHELFGEYFHPEKNDDYTYDINAEYNVKVRINGVEHDIKCSADTSLLRAMEKAGLNPPSDCRSGKCGWCHSQLISGKVYIPKSVDGRRLADKEFGYIHPCCSFPISDIVIDVPTLPLS